MSKEQPKSPQKSQDESSIKPKRSVRQPTRKQKEFARIIATEPKTSQTEAYIRAYNTEGYNSRGAITEEAKKTLRNPSVQMELSKYSDLAEQKIVNTIREWGDHEKPRQREIAMDMAKFVHDKVHGKAKQRHEVQSTSVNINLDLTAAPDEDD